MRKIKNPLIFIFITILIDCIGIRLVLPVAASIVAEVSNTNLTEAVSYSGWLMTSYAIMQFIFSPILGSISDKYGRRPVLFISLLGLGIDYIFLATANSLLLLFVGRLIAGIGGASLSTGFAYVADISLPEKRAQNFGVISAAVGIGFIIGPVLGGVLSQWGTRIPFIAAACLTGINLVYGFLILPESLDKKNRSAFSFKAINPFNAFLHVKNNVLMRKMFLALFFVFLSAQALPSVWPFYTKYMYDWSDLEIGYSLAFVGIMVALVKGFGIKSAQNLFGTTKSIYIGLLLTATSFFLFSVADKAWMVYVIIVLYCLGGIVQPSIQAILSNKMGEDEQGKLQGMITSLVSLANILAPIIMTSLFHFFTRIHSVIFFPGAPFIAAGSFVLVGFFILFQIKQ